MMKHNVAELYDRRTVLTERTFRDGFEIPLGIYINIKPMDSAPRRAIAGLISRSLHFEDLGETAWLHRPSAKDNADGRELSPVLERKEGRGDRRAVEVHASRLLLIAYLGTAPVYWLPGLSSGSVSLGKTALIALSVAAIGVAGWHRRTLAFPPGLLGWAGFAFLCVAALPGLVSAGGGFAWGPILDLLYGFVFMWTFYNFIRLGGRPWSVFGPALGAMTVFSALVAGAAVVGVPDWPSPFGRRLSLANAGFGGLRTGWSNGVALYVPLALALSGIAVERYRRLLLLGSAVSAATMFGSQLGVGGRAGLLAGLIGSLAYVFASWNRKTVVSVVLAFVLIAGLGRTPFVKRDLLAESRIGKTTSRVVENFISSGRTPPERSSSSRSTARDGSGDLSRARTNRGDDTASADLILLDTLSSGRVQGYLIGIDLLKEKPFGAYGYGTIDLKDFGLGYSDIHNFWLKIWVDFGLVFMLAFGAFVVVVFVTAAKTAFQASDRTRRRAAFSWAAVIGVGVIISVLEPATLLGAFQNVALWWAVAGAAAAAAEERDGV